MSEKLWQIDIAITHYTVNSIMITLIEVWRLYAVGTEAILVLLHILYLLLNIDVAVPIARHLRPLYDLLLLGVLNLLDLLDILLNVLAHVEEIDLVHVSRI